VPVLSAPAGSKSAQQDKTEVIVPLEIEAIKPAPIKSMQVNKLQPEHNPAAEDSIKALSVRQTIVNYENSYDEGEKDIRQVAMVKKLEQMDAENSQSLEPIKINIAKEKNKVNPDAAADQNLTQSPKAMISKADLTKEALAMTSSLHQDMASLVVEAVKKDTLNQDNYKAVIDSINETEEWINTTAPDSATTNDFHKYVIAQSNRSEPDTLPRIIKNYMIMRTKLEAPGVKNNVVKDSLVVANEKDIEPLAVVNQNITLKPDVVKPQETIKTQNDLGKKVRVMSGSLHQDMADFIGKSVEKGAVTQDNYQNVINSIQETEDWINNAALESVTTKDFHKYIIDQSSRPEPDSLEHIINNYRIIHTKLNTPTEKQKVEIPSLPSPAITVK
jgi:hypothetical protein